MREIEFSPEQLANESRYISGLSIENGRLVSTIPYGQNDYDATVEEVGETKTWTDQFSSLNLDMSATGASIVSDGINGNLSARFDNTDDRAVASTASDWTYLHDGSAMTVYFVSEVSGSGVGNPFISTGNTNSETGIFVLRDDRDPRTNAFVFALYDGSSSTLGQIDASGEAPADSREIYTLQCNGSGDYAAYRGKTQIGSLTGVTGQDTKEPQYAFRVGETAGFTTNGDVGRVLTYKTNHDTETRESVVDSLANQFGISL